MTTTTQPVRVYATLAVFETMEAAGRCYDRLHPFIMALAAERNTGLTRGQMLGSLPFIAVTGFDPLTAQEIETIIEIVRETDGALIDPPADLIKALILRRAREVTAMSRPGQDTWDHRNMNHVIDTSGRVVGHDFPNQGESNAQA